MPGHLEAGILTVTTAAASLRPIMGVVTVTVWYRAHHSHGNRSNNNKLRNTLQETLSLEVWGNDALCAW